MRLLGRNRPQRPSLLPSLTAEILAIIVFHGGSQEDLPYDRRILRVLSQVNRQLRNWSFPEMLQTVTIPDATQFSAFRDRYIPHVRQFRPIRLLRVGRDADYFNVGRIMAPSLRHASEVLSSDPMRALRTCEWFANACDYDMYRLLACLPGLESLGLLLEDAKSLQNFTFTAARFPKLRHLRIRSLERAAADMRMFAHLDTLSLTGIVPYVGPDFFGIHLPRMRVLSLHEVKAIHPANIFSFVARHGDLTEVSVSLCEPPEGPGFVRLVPLIKLIMGTGVWYPGQESLHVNYFTNVVLHRPPGVRVNNRFEPSLDDPSGQPPNIPQGANYTRFAAVKLSAFSFARRIVTSPGMKGESKYTYQLHELAVKGTQDERSAGTVVDIALLCHHSLAASLERLSVSTSHDFLEVEYVSFMTKMRDIMSNFSRLKSLSFNIPIPTDWAWSANCYRAGHINNALDAVTPPIRADGRSMRVVDGTHVLRVEIPDVLRQISTSNTYKTDYAASDPNHFPLMALWGEQHRAAMKEGVVALASGLGALEELRWYPSPVGLPVAREFVPCWTWKIDRRGGRLDASGDLWWRDCGKRRAQPPHVLVGQELEWAWKSA